jgi:hypothetical protein
MAQIVATPKDIKEAFERVKGEDYKAYEKRSDAMYHKLMVEAEALPDGEIVGAIIYFHFADGHAMYRVASAKPLRLQHLPYGDSWHADAATIRGLRLADVEKMVKRNRSLAELVPFRSAA